MRPNQGKLLPTIAAIALLLLASTAAAQQIDVVLDSVKQVDDRHIESYFLLINPAGDANGVISVANSDNLQLDTTARNWQCFRSQDQPANTCSATIQVVGQQRVTLRFLLKKFFDSDFVYVTYQSPATNTTMINKFLISHTADPNRITASSLFYTALLLVLIGLVAWVVAFESGKLKCLPGAAGRVFEALNESILFGAVLSSLLISLGIVIIFSPAYSPFTVALFASVFAMCVLFLFHARQVTGRADYVCPPDISREKGKLEEMVKIARGKYMRNEIDEKTFRDVVDRIEMDIIRLEAGVKRRGY